MKLHATVPTPIKVADVDKLMVPLVNHINGFSTAVTWFSCQGDPGDPDDDRNARIISRPYCCFSCGDPLQLMQILAIIPDSAAVCEVEYSQIWHCLRYTFRFASQQALVDVNEYLADASC